MDRTFEQTVADLSMLLRDQPAWTTADVTESAVVYIVEGALRGVFLKDDEPDQLDAPFAVDAWFIGQIQENLDDWFARPVYSRRISLPTWSLDAPPAESVD